MGIRNFPGIMRLPQAVKDERAAVTVEYLVLAMPLFIMFFFAIEVAGTYFLLLSLEKAAQRGVRIAAVRAPAATGVPGRNVRSATGTFGLHCRAAGNNCVPPSPAIWICDGSTGTGCEFAAFDTIAKEMRRFSTIVETDLITITYVYTGLGYAGGPFVPEVEVSIRNQAAANGQINNPFGALSLLRWVFSMDTLGIPPVRATISGEDLTTNYS